MTTRHKATEHVTIRWLIGRDMPEVLMIESASFDHPWTAEEFSAVLRHRATIGMVAERGQEVVGFMIYELEPGWIDLLDFAVHPQYTRRGIGSMMVERMIAKLWQQGRDRIKAKVWERNLVAQQFFRAAGFKVVNTVPDESGMFEDDDAYVFQFDLRGE